MTPEDVIKAVMKEKGYSYATLAEKMGHSNASYISERLRRKTTLRTDRFIEILEAMDCEIVVKDKIGKKQSWKVDNE